MSWKTLDDMDLDGKTVLVRVDINVPLDDQGNVTDATRIERIVPTVKDILDKGGKPVLMAHFGRPKGKVVPEMSLKPLVPALSAAFDAPVKFADNCIGGPAKIAVSKLEPGEVLLLENTRFHPEETDNEASFAAALAALGEVYVNDAFSASHRAHASTEGVARIMTNCAGRLMEAELKALEAALSNPVRPVVAVVGGAKVSTKLELLGNLVEKVDNLVIGGGMANTFLAAQGIDVGKSLCEHDMADTAREIMEKADEAGCKIILPTDVVVAREFKAGAENETVAADACPSDAMILDAGPDTVDTIAKAFENASTLIWNGPLGAFEIEPFDAATNAAAQKAGALSKEGRLTSVAGGGDTVAALNKAGVADDFTYISTAGGAFLEWMEGKTLPGVAALEG
ncbi:MULTISPECIES: phosphoglycerate kinase [Maritimibacter]|uniref:phosphoglycerate kinase n=1 Tax=Maritimibacter TaxID=404235 RepID=UPI0011097A3B|nr:MULTISPECIES: phosphoglycerate kinase [Maritimibacter]MBL6429366.1 phosphoglycerate kinase [Maritimibacter sp.]